METEDEKLFQVEDVDITSYESITVPSTMRSLYWKYFGFPSDNFNNILSRKKVVCILCHTFIAYNKNTTNLRTHLVAKHSDILIQLNEEKKNFNKQKSSIKPPAAAARAKRIRKTATKTSSSATSVLNSRQELTGIVDYSTLSSVTITNNGKTAINAIDNNENNKASTITIIHRSDSDLDNKPKMENLCLKLPSNVVSIIESIKSAENSGGNFVIEHDDVGDNDDDDDKCLIAPVVEMATDTEFIEETDFQTYSSVTLPSTSDDQNFKTEELNINQLKNEKYTVLKQSDNKSNNRTNNTASMYDNNNNIANIIEMITKDLLPTNIIEGIGFQNYVSNLNQNYIMPQKTEVDSKIKEIYQNKFAKLKNSLIELCDQHEFSIGLEIFENFEHKTFLNVYFNYYDDNLQSQQPQQQQQSQQLQEQEDNTPNLFNVFYKTIELRQSNSCNNNTSELLLKLFDGINMKNCSAAVINEYNNSLNEFLSQNEIPAIMCFEAVMCLCIEKVFKLPEVLKVLADIENCIDFYSDDNEEFESITFSCKNSWSKLNLLSVFYDNSIWIDDQKFIIKVKIIRNALLPLKVTLDTLTDEPIAFCSLIKPFTTKLLEDHFSPSENDNELIMQIKKLISDELKKYIETNAFYSEAAFFDPRFQYFIDPEGIQKVTKNLCDKFKENIIKENIKYLNDDNPTNKRSSLKQFFNRPERTTNTGKNNFDAELTKYVSEANADLEQCPLAWWMECGYNYRELKKISQKYLCVPCCVTNIFRYKISEQIKIMNRRYNLNDKSTINQLWFLHYNKDLP